MKQRIIETNRPEDPLYDKQGNLRPLPTVDTFDPRNRPGPVQTGALPAKPPKDSGEK